MRILFIGLFLLILCIKGDDSFTYNICFSIGPSLHRFSTKQLFKTLQNVDFVVPMETVALANFQLMPFFAGQVRFLPTNHFLFTAFAGGGSFKNGAATVNDLVTAVGDFVVIPTVGCDPRYSMFGPALLSARTHGCVFMLDVNIGSDWYSKCCNCIFNPLLGYVFNKQQLSIFSLVNTINQYYNNTWQGPYIGLETVFCIGDYIQIIPIYKFVIARLKSTLQVSQKNPNLFSDPISASPQYSTWGGNAFGNHVGIAWWYKENWWRIGTNITYLHYNNHKKMKVHLGSENILIPQNQIATSSSIIQNMWQQLICTVSIEWNF